MVTIGSMIHASIQSFCGSLYSPASKACNAVLHLVCPSTKDATMSRRFQGICRLVGKYEFESRLGITFRPATCRENKFSSLAICLSRNHANLGERHTNEHLSLTQVFSLHSINDISANNDCPSTSFVASIGRPDGRHRVFLTQMCVSLFGSAIVFANG